MMNLRPSICLVSQYTLLAFGTCPKERDRERERERERGREREREDCRQKRIQACTTLRTGRKKKSGEELGHLSIPES